MWVMSFLDFLPSLPFVYVTNSNNYNSLAQVSGTHIRFSQGTFEANGFIISTLQVRKLRQGTLRNCPRLLTNVSSKVRIRTWLTFVILTPVFSFYSLTNRCFLLVRACLHLVKTRGSGQEKEGPI